MVIFKYRGEQSSLNIGTGGQSDVQYRLLTDMVLKMVAVFAQAQCLHTNLYVRKNSVIHIT